MKGCQAPSTSATRVDVLVVETEACHLCDDAKRVLAERADDLGLHVRSLSAQSPEGQHLVAEHRAPMMPLVFVDGELLGWGRLSRRKLERRAAAARTKAAV